MAERWVTQTRFYDPELGLRGNCMQAAVASLLGLTLFEVPNFIEETSDKGPGAFWRMIEEFFNEHGYTLLERAGSARPPVLYLASGPSPRGVSHTVIMKAGELVHDPHPSRAGIYEVNYVHVPVPLDPAALRKVAA